MFASVAVPFERESVLQFGNFNSRITAWKRDSLRNGSISTSVFMSPRPGSYSCSALSSHSSALGMLPHCA
jgi:hypothetical protein